MQVLPGVVVSVRRTHGGKVGVSGVYSDTPNGVTGLGVPP